MPAALDTLGTPQPPMKWRRWDHPTRYERDLKIVEAHAYGAALQQIGAEFGLTRKRVGQILAANNIVSEAPQSRRGRRVRYGRNLKIAEARARGATLQEIGVEFGLTGERVRQILAANNDRAG
jgi:DNA-directed RNA polymerase sigma subunit (sigma70/sigma32)